MSHSKAQRLSCGGRPAALSFRSGGDQQGTRQRRSHGALLTLPSFVDRLAVNLQFPMNTVPGPNPKLPVITRRRFFKLGALGSAVAYLGPRSAWAVAKNPPEAAEATENPEYLTCEEDFVNVGRGNPPPHELSREKRRAVGLTRETWQLEVVPDSQSDAQLEHSLTKDKGNAFTWGQLMSLAEQRAVRFLHVVSCTNMPKPLGMGLWEGVPLREVIWLTRPKTNIRRVYYYGYHNDDPKQRFQSSLPVSRVLEELPGELSVMLCYKLNGQWLTPKRGGPVRMVVPGVYGNKSVKWLQQVILTNDPRQNDTYADWNNDTDSSLKTCASFRSVPRKAKANQPLAITGVAQVGMGGLSKVQYWVSSEQTLPPADPYFSTADWRDAEILPPPTRWGGGLPEGKLPEVPLQFDANTKRPREWPIPGTVALWRAQINDLKPGEYTLRCRTIDVKGVAQPMPRPFPKSGYNAIQKVTMIVES
jgi:DMSO/TMAO reductase YedYZ molybdopterin-dependent catalytic subunit